MAGEPEVQITYQLNAGPEPLQSIALVPHDRQFYGVVREGSAEFMVSRPQVERLLRSLSDYAAVGS